MLTPPKIFTAIQAHCLSKQNAVEDYPWDHVAWKVKKKIFVIGTRGEAQFTIKSTPSRQSQLILHPNIEVASYVGRFGWVTVTIDDEDMLELAIAIIDEAYDSIVLKVVARKTQADK